MKQALGMKLRSIGTAGIIILAASLTSLPSLAGLRVAIYAESGSDGESLLALARNVALGGHTPLTVTDEDLNLGLLTADHFDVFILPEGQRGNITYYYENLNQQGLDDAIRNFVSAGGGFIGMGAGARYAATTERWSDVDYPRLALWDGTAVGPMWSFGDGQCAIDISASWTAGYDAGPERVVFVGYGGAFFEGGSGETLATYNSGRSADVEQGQPAIVRFSYGSGRGVLSGPLFHLDVRSYGDWVAWDDRIMHSYDGEHDQGLLISFLEWVGGGADTRPPSLVPELSTGERIALYTTRRPNTTDENVGAYPGMLAAVGRALEYSGYQPLTIRDQEIYWLDLDNSRYDAVLFPGGFASGYWNQLFGYEYLIREFVTAGGGYVGISAGAFYASDEIIWQGVPYNYPLDLYGGVLEGPLSDLPAWPNHALTQIEITDPDSSIPNGVYSTWYQGEGFYHEPLESATKVGHYDHGGINQGKAALIRHDYGAGKVVYPNLHLEAEEGSTRDWMFTGDNDALGPVVDPESEWDLFAALVAWALPTIPASAPARPSVALASRFGEWDSTWEWVSETQDDDAYGDTPTELVYGDGRLAVIAGATMHVAGFGAKTRLSLPVAQLEVEYSTTAGYQGSEAIYWTVNGADYFSTGLVPVASQTDAAQSYDLFAAGVDTLEELRSLAIYFDNGGAAGEPISFDRVWIRLAADADADGAPDSVDCDPNAPGAYGDVVDPVLVWEGKSEVGWQDMAPDAGEGTAYELATGDLAQLRSDGGFDSAVCATLYVPSLAVEDPVAGSGSYQLVRATNACSDSGWGNRGASLPSCP